jgi:hypothetical protein
MPLVTTYSAQRLLPALLNPPFSEDAVPFVASLTVARGTILGQVTASKKYALYASGNSDGTQVAKCIAEYDFNTDTNGNVTFTATSGQLVGDLAQTYTTAPVYIGGTFNTTELNVGGVAGSGLGVTAAILTDLGGHMVKGLAASSGTYGIMSF